MFSKLYAAFALTVTAALVRFHFFSSAWSSLCGRTFWRGRTDRNQIAITFDDGPHPRFTRDILLTLKKEQVPATFFLVGKKVEAFPDVVREIVGAGHEVGLHGYTHRSFGSMTHLTLRDEFERSRDAIKKALSIEPLLIRPPGGSCGRYLLDLARDRACKIVLWNRAGWDWTDIPAEEVARRALEKPKAGNILLLHDGDGESLDGDRHRTVDALGIIIRELKCQGFSFAKVSEILPGG
jgi:peptidoglycan-N-acetylglucosamine deacetylase